MTYNLSKTVNDLLIAYVEANYQGYVDTIATANGVSLDSLTSVGIGGPAFMDKNKRKPYMLVEPVGEDIDDQIAGSVEVTMRYDVLIEALAPNEETALTAVGLYKDAFVSMILSDDTLGGEVDHAKVTNVEQYPGGSGTSKFILMAVEITVSQGR